MGHCTAFCRKFCSRRDIAEWIKDGFECTCACHEVEEAKEDGEEIEEVEAEIVENAEEIDGEEL